MKFWLGLLLLALAMVAQAETWRFALIGDTPYSDYERAELPKMMAAIADSHVDFVAHIGDIKNGGSRCDDEVFADRLQLFNSSRVPFVYVPGDNEWTDCKRVSNGSYDSGERLSKLRQMFWTEDFSLGRTKMPLQRQSASYPENARFQLGPVLFVTVNVPGSNNNRDESANGGPEFAARNRAVLDWIRQGFAIARKDQLRAVAVLMQANPGIKHFNQGIPANGYRELLETLRRESLNFRGQVLLLHGDTHHHRIDHPLRDADGNTLMRLTRVESYGYPFMGWVRVVIDSDSPELFRFESHNWTAADQARNN